MRYVVRTSYTLRVDTLGRHALEYVYWYHAIWTGSIMRQEQQCKATAGGLRCGLHLGHYSDESTDHSDNGRTFGSARRDYELQPLADALSIHVRGLTGASVQHTGGNVYSVVASMGAWTLYADEEGWSISDASGDGIHSGGYFVPDGAHVAPDAYSLLVDEGTGTLNADECDAAAVALVAALRESVIRAAVEQGRREILADIERGRVPASVPSFGALHDYTDANEYGGLCSGAPWVGTDGFLADEWIDAANTVQDRLDTWIRESRMPTTH